MVMGCVFFEVRTEFLNIIYTSLGFNGLTPNSRHSFVPIYQHINLFS
jgi:hypothetical protein